MSKHRRRTVVLTIRRILADRHIPKLFPGKHRYCALLDYRPSPVITNPAGFTAMAARHAGATK